MTRALGKVENLMVDLPTARIVYVIISFDGTEKSHYAVPPEALMLTSDNKTLLLDESKAKIQERAHEDDYFWTIMTEKGWAANTYRAYGVEPDFDMGAVKSDPTREQVREKIQDAAPSKAAGKSDAEISRMILTAMVQDDMSAVFNHKNIKITTNVAMAHVTWSGRVKNEKQKEKLGANHGRRGGSGVMWKTSSRSSGGQGAELSGRLDQIRRYDNFEFFFLVVVKDDNGDGFADRSLQELFEVTDIFLRRRGFDGVGDSGSSFDDFAVASGLVDRLSPGNGGQRWIQPRRENAPEWRS